MDAFVDDVAFESLLSHGHLSSGLHGLADGRASGAGRGDERVGRRAPDVGTAQRFPLPPRIPPPRGVGEVRRAPPLGAVRACLAVRRPAYAAGRSVAHREASVPWSSRSS